MAPRRSQARRATLENAVASPPGSHTPGTAAGATALDAVATRAPASPRGPPHVFERFWRADKAPPARRRHRHRPRHRPPDRESPRQSSCTFQGRRRLLVLIAPGRRPRHQPTPPTATTSHEPNRSPPRSSAPYPPSFGRRGMAARRVSPLRTALLCLARSPTRHTRLVLSTAGGNRFHSRRLSHRAPGLRTKPTAPTRQCAPARPRPRPPGTGGPPAPGRPDRPRTGAVPASWDRPRHPPPPRPRPRS